MGSHGVTRCPAQGTWEECACLSGCRSLRGWSVAWPGHRAPSSLLLSLGCLSAGMLAGWECSQQGFFPVRATDSSWSLGTAPPWAGATGETGWGGSAGRGGTAPTALRLGPGLGSHPLWEMQGGPSEGTAGLLEKRWEALGTRDLTSARQEHGWSYPPSPHFLQSAHASGRGAASNSILRWGCICSDPGSLASRDHQPLHEVALLSLSPVSLLHLAGAP